MSCRNQTEVGMTGFIYWKQGMTLLVDKVHEQEPQRI